LYVHKRIISAVNRVEFVVHNTKRSLCDIVVLNVYAPTENKLMILSTASTRN
jgi:hypothetical protein